MDNVQAAQRTFVSKSLMKLGKATATAVLSMEYMKRLNPAAAKMRYRRMSGRVFEDTEYGLAIGSRGDAPCIAVYPVHGPWVKLTEEEGRLQFDWPS